VIIKLLLEAKKVRAGHKPVGFGQIARTRPSARSDNRRRTHVGFGPPEFVRRGAGPTPESVPKRRSIIEAQRVGDVFDAEARVTNILYGELDPHLVD